MSILNTDKLMRLFQENWQRKGPTWAFTGWPYGESMSKMTRAKAIARGERKHVRQASLWLITATLLVLSSCLFASAQQAPDPSEAKRPIDSLPIAKEYDYKTVDPNLAKREKRAAQRVIRDKIRSDAKAIKTALQGGNVSSVSSFSNYLSGYVLAKMTQTDKETLSKLGKLRDDFVDDFLGERVTSASRRAVIEQSFPILRQIVENAGNKNYHAAVRLNAIYAIGSLHRSPGERSSGRLPSLSPNSMNYLTSVFIDENRPEFLRIGALACLEEQARLDRFRPQAELANRGQISQAASKIAQAPASSSGAYWMKRRAVRTIGWLGQGGSVDLLKSIAADKTEKRMLRYDAMEALGNLNYAAVAGAKAKEVPQVVAGFVADALEEESKGLLDKWNDLIEKNILYGDVDLVAVGTKKTGGRRGGGGSIGAGGGAGALEGGGGGPVQNEEEVEIGPKVEIANFRLNDSRRIIKIIANTAKNVISTNSLATHVDAAQVSNMKSALEDLIDESDIGIKNLDEDEKKLDPEDLEAIAEAKKPDTHKLSEKFAEYATIIREFDPSAKEAAFDEAAPDAQPAAAGN